MTSLTTAGSVLLQELADGHPLDLPPVEGPARKRSHGAVTPAVLDALARINDRTLTALACRQSGEGPDNQGE